MLESFKESFILQSGSDLILERFSLGQNELKNFNWDT